MLQIGDKVSWMSAAGYGEGLVVAVTQGKNAAGYVVPWVTFESRMKYLNRPDRTWKTTMCATEQNLKMMQVKVKND